MTAEFHSSAEYSEGADALYITFTTQPVARTRALDDLRNLDLDAGGEVVGIEFLQASDGLDLRDVPMWGSVVQLVEADGLPLPIL